MNIYIQQQTQRPEEDEGSVSPFKVADSNKRKKKGFLMTLFCGV